MDETTQSATQPGPPPRTGVTIQRPVVVGLLYLLNIFVGFAVFVGLVLADVWRRDADAEEWERTHHTYLIRTFWIGLAAFAAILVAWFAVMFVTGMDAADQGLGVFGAILAWLLVAVWFCVRCILSVMKAGEAKPMPRPRTWLL
jgi:uncharacterized membrane protein